MNGKRLTFVAGICFLLGASAAIGFSHPDSQLKSDRGSIVWTLDPSSWHQPPLKVTPGSDRGLTLKLYNVGVDTLTFEVTDDDDCIQASAGGSIPPGDSTTLTVTVNGSDPCDDTFIDGNVILNTDEGEGTTDSIPLQAVVSGEYYECPNDPETADTLDNGVLRLYVNANCEQWIEDVGTFPDTVHRILKTGGTIVATTLDNDTLVGRFMGSDWHSGAQDKLYEELCEVDWEPDFWILFTKDIFIHDLEPPANLKWWWWEISKQIKFFKETAPDVYRHLVIKYVTVQRKDPPGWWPQQPPFTGYEDAYIGMAMDIDCPADTMVDQYAPNYAGYDAANEIAWQEGFDYTGAHPEYNNYYCGIALADAGISEESLEPFGTYNVRSDQYLYPQDGWGWKEGELYQLASAAGNNVQDPSSAVDRALVFATYRIPAGTDSSAGASFVLVEAVAPNGIAQLREYVDTARAIVAREAEHGIPVICGDANGDGAIDVLDYLVIMKYSFSGGDPPPCPMLRADVNGDGIVNFNDAIFMANYLFSTTMELELDCPGLGFLPHGQPPGAENDRGEPDTMYIEPWPADTLLEGEGPYLVRVPIYVTNDLADVWDSIYGFVIPLSFTHSNPSMYCSVTDYWNQTTLLPYDPAIDRSIFRDMPDNDNPEIYNRMFSMERDYSQRGWNSIILDLDGTSHFRLAMVPTGSQDQRWWEGSRTLLATVTFKLEDSMRVCIDTCFWPPSSRLSWFTEKEGGGGSSAKIPRPGTGDPNSFEVCFGHGEAELPLDCSQSYSDPCLVACPLGDIPFKVYLRNTEGSPMVNYSNVWLDFSDCSGIVPCSTETTWPIVYPDGPSDSDGVLIFYVNAGGCDDVNQVQVMADCGLIGNKLRPVKTVDPDGDLVVRVDDWYGVGGSTCNDYNCNGEVNLWDLEFFREHLDHSCIQDSCLLLKQYLTATPDTLLPVDSVHQIRLFIQNNNSVPCSVTTVTFNRAGFGQGTTLIQFALRDLNITLQPGDTVTAEADFVVPGPGSGYILTELLTECCDHPLEAIFDFTRRMCPPDSMVYVFPLLLGTVPAYVETLDYVPDTLGWYWFIYESGGIPDSVAIVTPDTSTLGVTGGVTLRFRDSYNNLLADRTCEVRITLNSGDVTADCIVNVNDAISILNYLFRGGDEPNPKRAGDVNCDCITTIDDAIYILNYLFRNGSPPVSSETCECGYKGELWW